MLKQAKKSGAKGVTSEFFCMEARAYETTKKRYKAMSNSLGFDIYQYYMKNSKVSGYKRLNEDIKRPIFTAIKRCAHSLGLQFNCSDQYCRDLNDTCNCCGAKDQWSYTGGLQSAINKAKLTGYARYKDIQPEIDKYFNFLLSAACQFNTSSTKARAKYGDFTMREYIRYCWNEQKQKSLHGYGKLFVAEGIDDDNNVIYRYIRS